MRLTKKQSEWLTYVVVRPLFALPAWLFRLKTDVFLFCFLLFDTPIRRLAYANLDRAFPEKSREEKKLLAGKVFRELAGNCHLTTRLSGRRHVDKITEVEGLNHLDKALADGRGVLALSAHLGNFPLPLVYLGRRGYPVKTLIRDLSNPYFNRYYKTLMNRGGVIQIPRHPASLSIRESLGWLKKGHILFILSDQHSKHGVLAPFFGHQVGTPAGAAVFARRTDCAVLPVSIRRQGRRHLLRIEPPLQLPRTADRDADVAEITRIFNRVFEGWVREAPEQWLGWLTHRFRGMGNADLPPNR